MAASAAPKTDVSTRLTGHLRDAPARAHTERGREGKRDHTGGFDEYHMER